MQVWLPQLPDAGQPSLREWSNYVRQNAPFAIDQDCLIIGHSSGAILALILAQQNQTPVGAVVAVSVFHDNSLNWEPNNRLFDVRFDWRAIRDNTQKMLFVHSDNDPYVPLDQAEYVSKNCGQQMTIIAGQGHFNLEQSPNFRTFPGLLDLLREHDMIRS